jgi:hypothetical protein
MFQYTAHIDCYLTYGTTCSYDRYTVLLKTQREGIREDFSQAQTRSSARELSPDNDRRRASSSNVPGGHHLQHTLVRLLILDETKDVLDIYRREKLYRLAP